MSARYVQSLRYNVQQCDWLLNNIGYIVNAKGTPDLSQDCLLYTSPSPRDRG